jgi:hypothetical protein
MWPQRSPDLKPCDFFLWVYLKRKFNNPIPKAIDDLKAKIEREIKKINGDILKFSKKIEINYLGQWWSY